MESLDISLQQSSVGGSSAAEASLLLGSEEGFGDDGALRLRRLTGWGGSGGGTEGARTDPPAVLRGMALGMEGDSGTGGLVCSCVEDGVRGGGRAGSTVGRGGAARFAVNIMKQSLQS